LLAGVSIAGGSFALGMAGISVAAALHVVLDPPARLLAGPRRAGPVAQVLAGPIEEVPRVLLLAGFGHRFGQAFAVGLGWGVLHAVGVTAVVTLGLLASTTTSTGPAVGHSPEVQARNMVFLAVWQAVPRSWP